jgi:GAF domain-containing protein
MRDSNKRWWSDQALERSLNEVRGLGDTIQAVSASLDLQKVLQTIVVHATELSGSDGGLIYEFDEDAQVFRFRAGHRLRPEFIAALEAAPPTLRDSIVGRAVVTGVPQNIPDMGLDTLSALKTPILAEGYRSSWRFRPSGDRLFGGSCWPQGHRRLQRAGDRSAAHSPTAAPSRPSTPGCSRGGASPRLAGQYTNRTSPT